MPGVSAPPARLTRTTDDRKVAGVCGGIGRYLGIDPVIPRIAFIVATIAGGSGLLVYLAAWLLMPQSGDKRDYDDIAKLDPNTSRTAGFVVLGIGAIVLFGGWHGSDILLPVLLIGGGVWLLMRGHEHFGYDHDFDDDDDLPRTEGDGAGWSSSGWTSSALSQDPGRGMHSSAGDVAEDEDEDEDPLLAEARRLRDPFASDVVVTPPVASPPPSAVTTRRRPVVAGVTVGVLLILAGALGAAAASGAEIDLELALLAGLAVTSGGLLIGAFAGGARGLIVPAALMVLALTSVNAVDLTLAGGVGDRSYVVEEVQDIQDSYELGIGQLTLDLSGLDVDALPPRTMIDVSVGMGSTRILLPSGVRTEVDVTVSAGDIRFFDQRWDGTGLSITQATNAPEGAPVIVLNIRNGVGEVRIR